MKTIIIGKNIRYQILDATLVELPFRLSEIRCGGFSIDSLNKKYAESNTIPLSFYQSDDIYDDADLAIIFWDCYDNSIDEVINKAIKKSLFVIVYNEEGRFVATYNSV